MGRIGTALVLAAVAGTAISAQAPKQPDWKTVEDETMRHFQAVLRLDTRNPPGNEHLAADYLKQVFDKEGIPAQIFALDPNRSNVVARLKGNGREGRCKITLTGPVLEQPTRVLAEMHPSRFTAARPSGRPFSATRNRNSATRSQLD